MKPITIALSFLFLSASAPPVDHPDDVCLTKEEQLLYTLIMDYRKEAKLPPIALSAKLTAVAKAHAEDLMDNYDFDPDGRCNPHSWSKKGKWSPCCYTADHKQAACMWEKPKEIAGYPGHGYEIAYYSSGGASAKEGLDGWKVSPGHNPLLVNTGIWEKVSWQSIGIAIHGNYGLVWFGTVTDDSKPTPCNSN